MAILLHLSGRQPLTHSQCLGLKGFKSNLREGCAIVLVVFGALTVFGVLNVFVNAAQT